MSDELTVHLSTDSLIEENVRRAADDFSFVDTAASLANNRGFLEGYRHFKLGQEDNKSYVWEALSAIGNSTAEVIYNNVINFVDNASNIDLCKVTALQSILSGFGLQYNVIDSYKLLPDEVKQLVDVLSINKKYLLKSDVLKQSLVNDLSTNTYDTLSGYIDNTKYESYLSTLFTNLIGSVIESIYVDELSTVKVYQKISDELVYGDVETTLNAQSTTAKLKKKYGLTDFDEEVVCDNIDDGTDSLENYSGIKATIIEHELSARAAAKYAVYPETRYAHYIEQRVKTYFNFLKNKYFSINSDIMSSKVYSADPNYYVYEAQPQIQFIKYVDVSYLEDKDLSSYVGKYHLTSKELGFVDDGYYAYDEVLSSVCQNLARTVLTIADIREKSKLSLQKSYMKGTFNILSYVINEYLIEYAKSNIALSELDGAKTAVEALQKHIQSDIELIEYYDTTEYFNLSTDVTPKAKSKRYVNDRFWEGEIDQTNSNTNFAFAEEQIEQFYLSTLNMQSKLPTKQGSLINFLSTIYAAGANRSYIDKNGKKVISTIPSLSADSEDMFNRFYGEDKVGNVPYYNHKNVTHASYQVHPYLYKFVETSQYDESITNAFFNDINQQLEDAQVLSSLDVHVGAYGEVINIALNNDYDYSGYKTRYEVSNHEIATGTRGAKNMVIDYDGAFYPPAAAEFLADADKCIESLSVEEKMHSTDGEERTFYEKYYSHLNLVPAQLKNIASQLNEYREQIQDIVKDKTTKKEVYDIYKYGRDVYDNSYILYKTYASETPSVKEKKDARGELWIRLSNHPIAFPAFAGKFPQADCTTTEKYNNLIDLILDKKLGETSYKDEPARYFYDLEIDDTKQYIVLPYYPEKHPTLSSYIYEGSDKWQNAQFLACKAIEEYNTIAGFNTLQLNSNRSTKFEGYVNANPLLSSSNGYAFVGFFRADKDLGLSFVLKSLKDGVESIPGGGKLEVKAVRLNTTSYKQPETTGSLTALNGMIFSPDVAFNFYNDQLVYVAPMEFSIGSLSIQNYVGSSGEQGFGKCDYELSTNGQTIYDDSTEMNSFDRLDGFIGVVEAIAGSNDVIQNGDMAVYNLHADPSYVPAYSGEIGKTDFTQSSYYTTSGKNYKCVELLGWSKRLDEAIARADVAAGIDSTYDDLLSQLKALADGRVFEHYTDDDDMSFKIVQSPHLSSISGDANITWTVDALADDRYIDEHRDTMRVIIYKESTYGKNPYYDGPLSALATSTGEWMNLYYTKGAGDTGAEVSANSVVVAGTYDVYKNSINASESNELYNIDEVAVQYDSGTKLLKLQFKKTKSDLSSWIAYHDINIIVIDERDLRVYAQYHFFDPMAYLSGKVAYDFETGTVDDQRKFWIEGASAPYQMKDHDLSTYDQLSDVQYLSGYSRLAFKNSEEDVWQLSSPMFYFPGTNEAFPSRLCDLYSKYGFSVSYTAAELSTIFTNQNLFIIQCTSSDELTSLGKVQIPLMYFSNFALRAYETYINDGGKHEYDVVDPRFFKHIKFSGDAMVDGGDAGSWTKIDLGTKFPTEFTPETLSATYQELVKSEHLSAVGIELGEIDDTESYVEFDASDLSAYTNERLSEYFNIYVNYQKNSDKKLTLYFNYVNYLNTPYVQKKATAFTSHVIDSTYLKLDPGENGRLDIVVQLKYYVNETDIGGFKNVTVASYQVYNLSDDKPKFLIAKI